MESTLAQTILDLMSHVKASCVHLYEIDPKRTTENEIKYRSIEKFSASITLDGRVMPNFYFTEDVWFHTTTMFKKNKHSKRACILASPILDYEVKDGKFVKQEHGKGYVKRTLKLMFERVPYTDGHRYEKGE